MNDQGDLWRYRVYGLHLSCNQEIPGLVVASKHESIDVCVHICQVDAERIEPASHALLYTSPGKTENDEYFFKVWKQAGRDDAYLCLRYTAGNRLAEFAINAGGSKVQVMWTGSIPFGDVVAYLLGPVIGCVLRLRRITCLHGGVVAVDGAAIAIIGPKGAGKSTTTAFLATRGHYVLSDDIAPLGEEQGKFVVQPGYPRLRLWPTAIEALSGVPAVDELPRVLSSYEKRYLDLSVNGGASPWRFHKDPLPLAAILMLGDRNRVQTVLIESPSPAKSLVGLIRNLYADYVVDRVERTRDFMLLGRLANTVPLYTVERPEGLDALPQIYDAMRGHFRAEPCVG